MLTQRPEAMRYPCGDGSFNWLMLFADCNRIDLTLVPLARQALLGSDSLTRVLLDKDGRFGALPPPSDRDYHVKKPSALFYTSCCNNFFWCLQNVAKGLARDEMPYALMMYHTVVQEELHDMLNWYIGAEHGFGVSAGKMGKYFKRYLPEELYALYARTYSDCDRGRVFDACDAACELFRMAAKYVGAQLNYAYPQSDDDGIRQYLQKVRADVRASEKIQ